MFPFPGHGAGFQAAVSCFPGFHPAIEACSLAWGNVNLSSDTEKPEGVLDASCVVNKSKHPVDVCTVPVAAATCAAEVEDETRSVEPGSVLPLICAVTDSHEDEEKS